MVDSQADDGVVLTGGHLLEVVLRARFDLGRASGRHGQRAALQFGKHGYSFLLSGSSSGMMLGSVWFQPFSATR
jgi:hypothetical protein